MKNIDPVESIIGEMAAILKLVLKESVEADKKKISIRWLFKLKVGVIKWYYRVIIMDHSKDAFFLLATLDIDGEVDKDHLKDQYRRICGLLSQFDQVGVTAPSLSNA